MPSPHPSPDPAPLRLITLPELSALLKTESVALWNAIARKGLRLHVMRGPAGDRMAITVEDAVRLQDGRTIPSPAHNAAGLTLVPGDKDRDHARAEIELLEFLEDSVQAYCDRLEQRLQSDL